MTSLTRWKLCCGVLLAITIYSWTHRDGSDGDGTAAAAPRSRAERVRPVRIDVAGRDRSADALVSELLAARTVADVAAIAAQLEVIGDDSTIDAIRPLIEDARDGVPAVILRAIGAIGTDHAVDVLCEVATRPMTDHAYEAVEALGLTHNPRAESLLAELATSDANLQSTAIGALGELGTDGAVGVLLAVAETGAYGDGSYAIETLGKMSPGRATAALARLIESPSLAVADHALRALAFLDDTLLAKLTAIVRSGPSELVDPAIAAVGRAGAIGLPLLFELALHAPLIVREEAIEAIASGRQPEAFGLLRDLLASKPDDGLVRTITLSLATLGTTDARELLIELALNDGAGADDAVDGLLQLGGPDVERALAAIADDGDPPREVLARLIVLGNADALAATVQRARAGLDDDRLDALQLLAEANTTASIGALSELVRNGDELLRTHGLRILAYVRPADPTVTDLVRDAVHSDVPDEAMAAIEQLSRSGTTAARDALIEAVASRDPAIADSAITGLESFRMTDATTAALRDAAAAHPELAPRVMARLLTAGSPEGVRMAEQVIAGEDPDTAMSAIWALADAGTESARDLLERTTRTADAGLRAYALETFAGAGDARAEAVVSQALRDPDPDVRYSAARSLATFGPDRERAALIDLLRDPDDGVRSRAVDALRGREDLEPSTLELVTRTADDLAAAAADATDGPAETADAAPDP